jgi:hypothetical protein
MKEIVLVTLAINTKTGEIDPKAPFTVNSRRRGPRYNCPFLKVSCALDEDEPAVTEQFRPGECQVRFEAERNDEKGDWIFGKRVDDV